jgi:hypothetical protein
LKEHFARFGLSVSVILMTTVREELDLPGYGCGYWSVGVPVAGGNHKAAGALLAVADFEQQHPFVKVMDFAIQPDPTDPAQRIAVLNLSALYRK